MLSDDVYRHLQWNWSVLKDQIKEMARLEIFHEDKYTEYENRKERLQREEEFYTGEMREALDEYEAAHPPEPPPE